MPGTIKVLLLAADPKAGSSGLRLDHEIRKALEAIRVGRAAHELEIVAELAVTADTMRDALLRHDPQIVHFAGHAEGEKGLVLDSGTRLSGAEVAALLGSFRDVRVVVLNACETLPVARALSEVVDYTISLEKKINDNAAVEFAGVFYAALAFGRAVPFAFHLGRREMRARYGAGHAIPHLLVRPGAEERPLEGRPAVSAPSAAPIRQETVAENVEAAGDGEIVNEAEGAGGVPSNQTTRAHGVKVGGSLKLGNRLKK
jgi:hypothetical protein